MLKFLSKLFKFINLCFFLKEDLQLIQKYGKSSYALITESSSSIGYQFARRFAEKGFNLILVSHDSKILEIQKKELKILRKNCQVTTIVFDTTKSTQPDHYQKLFTQIAEKDISFLVNTIQAPNEKFSENPITNLAENQKLSQEAECLNSTIVNT